MSWIISGIMFVLSVSFFSISCFIMVKKENNRSKKQAEEIIKHINENTISL